MSMHAWNYHNENYVWLCMKYNEIYDFVQLNIPMMFENISNETQMSLSCFRKLQESNTVGSYCAKCV